MKKNQSIRNNATGETLTMLVSDEENGGACQLYEVHLPPHRPGPPLHYHVDFIETFTVKQGKLDIYVDKDQKHLLLQPGESATAHIRQPHRFANDHDEPVIFHTQNEACWRCCKGISVGLRDSERRRGGQGRITQESDREVRIFQDHPGLPARYPTSTSENRFQLCRLSGKNRRAGEKVAGLFHIASGKIAVAGQNVNLKAGISALIPISNPKGVCRY